MPKAESKYIFLCAEMNALQKQNNSLDSIFRNSSLQIFACGEFGMDFVKPGVKRRILLQTSLAPEQRIIGENSDTVHSVSVILELSFRLSSLGGFV